MQIDSNLGLADLAGAGRRAAAAEAAGFDGVWAAETAHDPFLPLALAAEHTERVQLGTSIAVAFARNPMTLAHVGWDLQAMSGGRFVLGLGSQIKPHITKRFSMPWSHPARRMREMILAIRAVWDAWLGGAPLRFRGEFYTHTLMTPFFSPDPADLDGVGPPKIFLAGVGQAMTEVAGEVADGFISHGFQTERYLREVTIPALTRGRAKAGLTMDGFEVIGPGFVVTGFDERQHAASAAKVREQIAFYGSTPAYKPVLDLHGWGGLHDDLHALSKRGLWSEMGSLVTQEVLETFAIVAPPEGIAPELQRRYGDVVQRMVFKVPGGDEPARWAGTVAQMKAVSRSGS